MFAFVRKSHFVNLVFALALFASFAVAPATRAQAAAILPNMTVTLKANDANYYSATIYAGNPLIFRAKVRNTGNVPLQIVANLTVPNGWEVDQNSYSDCPKSLPVGNACTISWYFTPQVAGTVYLRVYARGLYTTSSGGTSRITNSPAFIFIVKPPKNK
jgi:hypothetical protein